MSREWKSESTETIAQSPQGISRLSKLKWWFLAGLVIAIALAIYVFYVTFGETLKSFAGHDINFFPLIDRAFAEAQQTPVPGFDYRPVVMLAIIVTLLIVLMGSVFTMLRSTNPATIAAASDLTKVLVGFFVGVGTKYLGA
jgi:hypothetical protein